MNIFILSYDPVKAAQMQCDQHVVKMPLESAQMLCTSFPNGEAPYRWTHYKHPCNVWIRESAANYQWLLTHGFALCDEYTYRYSKIHKSLDVLKWCEKNMKRIHFPKKQKTTFPVAMDDKYKRKTAIESYRNFYIQSKSDFARWNKNRPAPDWYTKNIELNL